MLRIGGSSGGDQAVPPPELEIFAEDPRWAYKVRGSRRVVYVEFVAICLGFWLRPWWMVRLVASSTMPREEVVSPILRRDLPTLSPTLTLTLTLTDDRPPIDVALVNPFVAGVCLHPPARHTQSQRASTHTTVGHACQKVAEKNYKLLKIPLPTCRTDCTRLLKISLPKRRETMGDFTVGSDVDSAVAIKWAISRRKCGAFKLRFKLGLITHW